MGSKRKSSRMFALLSFLASIWVISQGFFISVNDSVIAEYLIKFQYFLGASIAIVFYLFSHSYPYEKIVSRNTYVYSIFLIIFFIFSITFTDLIITRTYNIEGIQKWAWSFGKLHVVYDIFFYMTWSLGLINIYNNYRFENELNLKKNLKNMFIALFIGVLPATLGGITLPTFGIFDFNWIGPITSFIWVYIIAYSIIKYRQMEVSVVLTKILTIGVSIIFIINLLTGLYRDLRITFISLIIFCIIIFYLFITLEREDTYKKELNYINKNLEKIIESKSNELNKSFIKEYTARRDLEIVNRMKNYFILTTQHNIRTPINRISGKIDKISENRIVEDEDTITLKENIDELRTMIENFNDISSIEKRSQILKLEFVNINELVQNIIKKFNTDIHSKNIKIEFVTDDTIPTIYIDKIKICEVISILINNAIIYNKEYGNIIIKIVRVYREVFLSVSNDGLKISNAEIEKFRSSQFFRAHEAKKVNPSGMGVGLSIIKTIIEAHHGSVKIQSGELIMTSITLSIPINYIEDINME